MKLMNEPQFKTLTKIEVVTLIEHCKYYEQKGCPEWEKCPISGECILYATGANSFIDELEEGKV